jgi:hypothetical protein
MLYSFPGLWVARAPAMGGRGVVKILFKGYCLQLKKLAYFLITDRKSTDN